MKKRWIFLIIIVVFIILAFAVNKIYITNYYDKVRPDIISVYGRNGAVVANMGTYSWSKNVLGQTLYVDACGISPLEMNYNNTVKIAQGDSVKIDLSYDVTKIVVYKFDDDEANKIENNLKHDIQNQEINMSKLESGTYIIELFAKEGESNDVIYSFKLEVLDSIEEDIYGINSQTFYAEIKKINGTNLLVDGLDVNDINYRGEFSFKVTGQTKLEWRNTAIDFSELDEGDNISITFEGEIQETYPARINDVVRIQLLDDEK